MTRPPMTASDDADTPPLLAAGLYLVATPIGSARDITLRALDILAAADILAAEDTRTARKLLALHGIPLRGRPLIAYHDHNGPARRPGLLAALAEGKSVAYVSDAGTPLVADPGYRLARDAAEAGAHVTAAPGPSAALAALSVSALPSDRFLFAGFPPAQAGPRRRWIAGLASVEATLIIFVAGGRVSEILGEMCEGFGAGRRAALCRELTKRFEEVRRGTLDTLTEGVGAVPPKGEIVLVVEGSATPNVSEDDIDGALKRVLQTHSVKDAAAEIADVFGQPRKLVYRRALDLKAAQHRK